MDKIHLKVKGDRLAYILWLNKSQLQFDCQIDAMKTSTFTLFANLNPKIKLSPN